MKKVFQMMIALLSFGLAFAFTDNDLDGVDDSIDRCPNTPFNQIVGPDGCPLGKIGQEREGGIKGKFYLKIGVGYNKKNGNDSIYSSTSLAYAYKGFYTSLSSLYYIKDNFNNSSGIGDTYFYLSYSSFLLENLYTTIGLNTKIPTGKNSLSDKKFDFTPSITFDYIRGKDDYFIYYGRTFKGKSGVKDVNAFSIGVGYQFSYKFYSSLSLDGSSSIITGDYGYTISYFGLYNLSPKYYITLSYSYGLNNKALDHAIFTKFGVKF